MTIQYEGTTPIRLDTVVLSTQHAAHIDEKEQLPHDIRRHMHRRRAFKGNWPTSLGRLQASAQQFNLTGKFVVGGADGATVKACAARTRSSSTPTALGPPRWQGVLRQGPVQGGPFGGYAIRWVARAIVAAGPGQAGRVRAGLRDQPGGPGPVVRGTFGADRRSTHRRPSPRCSTCAALSSGLGPAARSTPRRPRTAFDRTDVDLPWERTDKVEDLKNSV